jgi:radical SAM superfamily enzyme YgiQ (UPF0313 family)
MLLVNPDSGIYRSIPNVGLAQIATGLRARVVDLNARPEPALRYLDLADSEVRVSVRSNTERAAEVIRERYLEKHPGARVASVTNCVDVQCCYPAVSWTDDLSIQPAFGDDLPFPDYALFDSFELFRDRWASGEWPYFILTSLGCPFGCSFCASRRRKVRARSVENCREELRLARDRWGIRSFSVLDDCFNVSRERAVGFCDAVRPLGLPWSCGNGLRADIFDDEVARALATSGCQAVSFGAESMDDAVLERIQKGETSEQIDRAVTIANRYFPGRVNCFFILGLPGSTYEADLATVRWAVGKGISANFSYFVDHTMDLGADVFHGGHAAPRSKAYDPILQERLYRLTSFMREGGGGRWRAVARAGRAVRLILAVDPWRLPGHVGRYAARYFAR